MTKTHGAAAPQHQHRVFRIAAAAALPPPPYLQERRYTLKRPFRPCGLFESAVIWLPARTCALLLGGPLLTFKDCDASLGDELVCAGEGDVTGRQPPARLPPVAKHLGEHAWPSHLARVLLKVVRILKNDSRRITRRFRNRDKDEGRKSKCSVFWASLDLIDQGSTRRHLREHSRPPGLGVATVFLHSRGPGICGAGRKCRRLATQFIVEPVHETCFCTVLHSKNSGDWLKGSRTAGSQGKVV